MLKAVVFDAYGTLFDLGRLDLLADELYPGKGSAVSEAWRRKQLEYSWWLSLMGRYQDFWSVTRLSLSYTLQALNLAAEESQLEQLMDAYLRLPTFPEVRASLLRLAERYPLALLSNGTEAMLEGVVAHNNLGPYLSHILSVDLVGVYKPSPKAYDLAIQAFFAIPSEIVFVSANGWDVGGAKGFGFGTAWCNRTGAPAETHAPSPDWTVENLEGLEALLP
ncbi:MAG: haloacid dehalogenase type II [Meiothermus ruber]|uniref:haloacid dehalogenase type II n=1 Tax=Meiothermus ruber TaxID=277 RepID=UPI0023F7B87A|nr:haloacid dehalogenase type II [Meiothermus ruber]MCL6529625.1 haloacid dehalogenase type II [Meiothermus ruber]